MPPNLRQPKGDRYHHGELRAALIETAIELIGEHGVREFSMAEASRRLGVAVSAPYAHFADRDELLAAVAVQAYDRFYAALAPCVDQEEDPSLRLAAMARAYVLFAATNRPLFELLYSVVLDKNRYPDIEAAERPLMDAFLGCVHTLCEGDEILSEQLASAVEATAHGHAQFLLNGEFGDGQDAVDQAAERAARSTLALVEGRQRLRWPSTP